MAGCLELACCATAAEDLLKAQDGPATTKLCPTRVEAGPCCSDHGLQEAGELGAGREVAAFHSGHACEAHVDEFMARPLFDKVPLRAVFLTELVASLLAGCHAKAGCQPAQWRASFLKELAASLLAGVPVF